MISELWLQMGKNAMNSYFDRNLPNLHLLNEYMDLNAVIL